MVTGTVLIDKNRALKIAKYVINAIQAIRNEILEVGIKKAMGRWPFPCKTREEAIKELNSDYMPLHKIWGWGNMDSAMDIIGACKIIVSDRIRLDPSTANWLYEEEIKMRRDDAKALVEFDKSLKSFKEKEPRCVKIVKLMAGNPGTGVYLASDIDPILAQFRCFKCKDVGTCVSAYDYYNIGDDCLMEK
jgi:hypothetical protein